jgi:hypothetical protein
LIKTLIHCCEEGDDQSDQGHYVSQEIQRKHKEVLTCRAPNALAGSVGILLFSTMSSSMAGMFLSLIKFSKAPLTLSRSL